MRILPSTFDVLYMTKFNRGALLAQLRAHIFQSLKAIRNLLSIGLPVCAKDALAMTQPAIELYRLALSIQTNTYAKRV